MRVAAQANFFDFRSVDFVFGAIGAGRRVVLDGSYLLPKFVWRNTRSKIRSKLERACSAERSHDVKT